MQNCLRCGLDTFFINHNNMCPDCVEIGPLQHVVVLLPSMESTSAEFLESIRENVVAEIHPIIVEENADVMFFKTAQQAIRSSYAVIALLDNKNKIYPAILGMLKYSDCKSVPVFLHVAEHLHSPALSVFADFVSYELDSIIFNLNWLLRKV